MKKILSLMVVMCTALCAYASDLTFNVAVEGNTVTVTPSVEDQLYFCSAVDEATIEYFVEYMAELGMQLDPTSPDVLLTIATGLNKDNYFTGVTTLTVAEGNNVLVMCEAQEDGEGGYHDLTTPVYQFEWIVDHNTTGISNVEAAIMVSKIFMDGKFILGGHVGLDGKLIVK